MSIVLPAQNHSQGIFWTQNKLYPEFRHSTRIRETFLVIQGNKTIMAIWTNLWLSNIWLFRAHSTEITRSWTIKMKSQITIDSNVMKMNPSLTGKDISIKTWKQTRIFKRTADGSEPSCLASSRQYTASSLRPSTLRFRYIHWKQPICKQARNLRQKLFRY